MARSVPAKGKREKCPAKTNLRSRLVDLRPSLILNMILSMHAWNLRFVTPSTVCKFHATGPHDAGLLHELASRTFVRYSTSDSHGVGYIPCRPGCEDAGQRLDFIDSLFQLHSTPRTPR